jgi:hypothetical protein
MEALGGKGWVLVNCLIYQGFLVPSAGAPPRDQTATNPSEAGRKAQRSAEAGESDECHKTE